MTPEGARLYFESEEGQRMKALLDGGFRAQAQAEKEAAALLGDVAPIDVSDDAHPED